MKIRLEMKNYNTRLIERLQKYQLYHQAKYEYLTGEEILPSNQQQIIEQAKFTLSPLGKAFEKQTKTNEDQGKKQVNALTFLESLKPKELKPKESKPIEYNDFFLKRLVEI